MEARFIIRKNSYYDSVTLMLITKEAGSLEGIGQVAVVMGTDHNKDILKNTGLYSPKMEQSTPNDLIIAALCKDEESFKIMVRLVENLFASRSQALGTQYRPSTLETAFKMMGGCNVVLISLPGAFAAQEAKKALENNKHVMLFSDNVPLAQEIELKKLASSKGLLMMGPDCGTAIINGTPLGFANVVSRGDIGIVGASGTGIQEVTTIIDKMGCGITHALGTGGRDLSLEVGGVMMIEGIKALGRDERTKVIVLVSKPPSKDVAVKVLETAKAVKKPVVVCFTGGGQELAEGFGMSGASSLEEAAFKAASISLGKPVEKYDYGARDTGYDKVMMEITKLQRGQRYIRALYTGGTLCDEALKHATKEIRGIYSNIPLIPEQNLENIEISKENCFIDLGDDFFTLGRPHPMIDPSVRQRRIIQEAEDTGTAVILLDFVLGFGAHQDPAGAMVPYILRAKDIAGSRGGHLSVVASLCGTLGDFQNLEMQRQKLLDAGVLVESTNARAVRCAIDIIKAAQGEGDNEGN